MKDDQSIYIKENRIFVCFGRGRICVANSSDDINQQMVWMGDTKKDRIIGMTTDMEKQWSWKEDIQGLEVIMGFDSIKSIEVLEEGLSIAKERLLNPESRTEDK